MKTIRKFLVLLLSYALAFTPLSAYPAFDPVNDDTDIFLANPDIPAVRPNVLLVIDNSANWNQPFVNEKNAIVSVINGLGEQFNVGLMIMSDSNIKRPGPTAKDGAYIRSHVRQMKGANKTNLASIVNNFHILNDKGDNNLAGMMMYEAYLYYGGKPARAGDDQRKADHDGTPDTLLQPLPGHALPGPDGTGFPTENGTYRSPIVDGCQKNFIIYISNGPANENAAQRAELEGYLATLTGKNPPDTIALTPNGQQGNWADEMARYMANADIDGNPANGVQNVITYTVEVNPVLTGQGPAMTALLKSMAFHGKGKYFGVTDDASGAAIADALNQIFAEIQAVNSVFAATTLPISVNTQGTNLNQVYIGMFRPDAQKAPRWLGNLKHYQLALDTATNTVFLADANGNPAVNPLTGFITSTATSFWSTASTYWAFRDPSQNGAGGASDAPDGELVEKGGAAQQVRAKYPNAETPQSGETLRKIYTCTNGGTFTSQCTPSAGGGAPGSPLSATPFADNNTDITTALLQLGTRPITTLTAFETKTVSSLVDRRTVILSNAGASVDVTNLSNGAVTRTITNLTTATPRVLTSLSAAQPNILVRSISTISKSGNAFVVTTTTAHGFTNGQAVVIQGNSVSSYNGTWTVQSAGTNTFTISGPTGNPGTGTGGTATVNAGFIDSTTAKAVLPAHGFTSGQSVTIAGASPSQFNGTFNITVVDADTFTYFISPAAGAATGTITASGNTTTATATTSVNHGFTPGSSVTISGASPNGYNGTFTITSVPTPTTFTYTVSSALSPNTASPVYAVQGGSTTVTATAPSHGFINGQTVIITGADVAGYNGTFTITVLDANTFQYTTSSVLPANNTYPVKASGSTQSIVTATLANHGFNAGDSVIIEGGTEPLHTSSGAGQPGGFTILTVPDANTFTYNNLAGASVPPTGTYTARPPTLSTRAYATVSSHGYSTGDQIVISGADPTAYNGTHTITVVDANTFFYPLTTAPGVNTSSAVVSRKQTTLARATSPAHGFSTGDSVTIAGASPAAFNGTFTVTVTDPNNFTYTIGSPQGDATGTIVASGTASAQRTSLIRWVRGEDNLQDENSNSSLTDIRASVHGDVLHSRPAVVNYNRFGGDNDVYIFYGANDGIFHAIKGGKATDPSDTTGLLPGQEAWGFIAQEHFGQLNRLRTNTPVIGSSAKKPYFFDGSVSVYTRDVNGDKKLVAADGDRVIIYLTARRGGRLLYALDVSNPLDPKFMWKIDNTTPGFSELGQTWSVPAVVAEGLRGYPNPVLVMSGGYDPAVEDVDPATITAFTATSITTASGTTNRTMGRALYVIDALTGQLIWRAVRSGDTSSNAAGAAQTTVPGLDYAIPSDVTVIKNESTGVINRAYVGDTGGQVWRIDFKSDNPSDPSVQNLRGTTVTRLASIADHSSLPGGLRKFLHAPDVVGQDGFDAVLIGSGDREHPFDTSVINRFYMFKDKGTDEGPVTGATTCDPTITEAPIPNASCTPNPIAGLSDLTSNCLQDASACLAGETQSGVSTKLGTDRGWFITLGTGEKVVGSAISLGGVTFFNTNQPSASAGGGTCGANLGIARAYQISTADATAVTDFNSSGGLTGADRATTVAGGGYLPDPVQVVVMLGEPAKPVEAVISGVKVSQPPGVSLQARLRKFWYKEVDR